MSFLFGMLGLYGSLIIAVGLERLIWSRAQRAVVAADKEWSDS